MIPTYFLMDRTVNIDLNIIDGSRMLRDGDFLPNITWLEGGTCQTMGHGSEGGELVSFGVEGIPTYPCIGRQGLLNTPNSLWPSLLEVLRSRKLIVGSPITIVKVMEG